MEVNGFGNNRKLLHRNAKRGSVGVGFFVRNDLFLDFNVSVLDDNNEGILWLKLTHKSENFTILPCVCYLPPKNSSRYFDVNNFFDNLLSDIYRYQKRVLYMYVVILIVDVET